MKKLLVIVLVLGVLYSFVIANEINVSHLETLYWIALEENGDMRSFHVAEDMIKSLLDQEELDDYDRDYILTLQSEINIQRDLASDTFAGLFPLVRFLNKMILLDAGAYLSYELVDDPDVIAVCNGAKKIIDKLNENLKNLPQMEIVIYSTPENQALENELLYIFNQDTRFLICPRQSLKKYLNQNEIAILKSDKADQKILKKIITQNEDKALLLIHIDLKDKYEDIYFFTIKASLYQEKANQVYNEITVFKNTLTRDRRKNFRYIMYLFLTGLLLSLIFNIKKRYKIYKSFSWVLIIYCSTIISSFVLTFFWVRYMPLMENLAKLSVWWIIIHGLLITIIPIILVNIIYNRIKRVIGILRINLSNTYIPLSFGLSFYYMHLFLIYNNYFPWYILLIPIPLITISVFFLNGLTQGYKQINFAIGFILSMFVSIIYLSNSQTLILIYTISSLLTYFLFEFFKKIITKSQKHLDVENKRNTELCTLEDLLEHIVYPRFYEFINCGELNELTKSILTSDYDLIFIYGNQGVGKSRLGDEIINRIKENNQFQKIEILSAICNNDENNISIQPLTELFGEYINLSLLNNNDKIYTPVLNDIVNSLVPLSSFISSEATEQNDEVNIAEIRNSIITAIHKICKRNDKVILYIDNSQWLSQPSLKVLDELMLETAKYKNLKIILISDNNNFYSFFNKFKIKLIQIEPHKLVDISSFLVSSFNIEKNIAKEIAEHIGFNDTDDNNNGQLHFILNTLKNLINRNVFVFNYEKLYFTFNENYNINLLPIPDSFYKSVIIQLSHLDREEIKIMKCAACLGKDVNIKILEIVLKMKRRDLIQYLDSIEEKTGLVVDKKEADNYYHFKTEFILKTIRKHYDIEFYNLNKKHSQLIKDYNYAIAEALTSLQLNVPGIQYRIAMHYLVVADSFQAKSIESCLIASRYGNKISEYKKTDLFLDLIDELTLYSGATNIIEVEKLKIKAQKSIQTGIGKSEILQEIEEMINNHEIVSHTLLLYSSRIYWSIGSLDIQYYMNAIKRSTEVLENHGSNEIEKSYAIDIILRSLDGLPKSLNILTLKRIINSLTVQELFSKLDLVNYAIEMTQKIELNQDQKAYRLANHYWIKANILRENSRKQAQVNIDQAIIYAVESKNKSLYCRLLIDKGELQSSKEDQLEIYLEVSNLAAKIDYFVGKARVDRKIAKTYIYMKQFKKALKFVASSFEASKKIGADDAAFQIIESMNQFIDLLIKSGELLEKNELQLMKSEFMGYLNDNINTMIQYKVTKSKIRTILKVLQNSKAGHIKLSIDDLKKFFENIVKKDNLDKESNVNSDMYISWLFGPYSENPEDMDADFLIFLVTNIGQYPSLKEILKRTLQFYRKNQKPVPLDLLLYIASMKDVKNYDLILRYIKANDYNNISLRLVTKLTEQSVHQVLSSEEVFKSLLTYIDSSIVELNNRLSILFNLLNEDPEFLRLSDARPTGSDFGKSLNDILTIYYKVKCGTNSISKKILRKIIMGISVEYKNIQKLGVENFRELKNEIDKIYEIFQTTTDK